MQLSVEGDVKKVLKDMDKVRKKVVPSAAALALNRTASGGKASVDKRGLIKRAIDAAAARTGLPKKHIKHRYRYNEDTGKPEPKPSKAGKGKTRRILQRKAHKAKARRLWTTITAYHRDIPWIVLGAKDSGKYVKGLPWGKMRKGKGVKIGRRGRDPKAFIATTKEHGVTQVFRRPTPSPHILNVVKLKVAKEIKKATERTVRMKGGVIFVKEFNKTLAHKLKLKGL
jgi:hypothetical protein